MKTDYTKLDAAILEAIKNERRTADDILKYAWVKHECLDLEAATSLKKPAFRFLDARLQALRKAGKIVFNHASRCWGLPA